MECRSNLLNPIKEYELYISYEIEEDYILFLNKNKNEDWVNKSDYIKILYYQQFKEKYLIETLEQAKEYIQNYKSSIEEQPFTFNSFIEEKVFNVINSLYIRKSNLFEKFKFLNDFRYKIENYILSNYPEDNFTADKINFNVNQNQSHESFESVFKFIFNYLRLVRMKGQKKNILSDDDYNKLKRRLENYVINRNIIEKSKIKFVGLKANGINNLLYAFNKKLSKEFKHEELFNFAIKNIYGYSVDMENTFVNKLRTKVSKSKHPYLKDIY